MSERPGDSFGKIEIELPEDSIAPPARAKSRTLEDRTRVGQVDPKLLAATRRPEEDVTSPASALRTRKPEPGSALEDPRLTAMRDLYASGDAEAALFVATAIQPRGAETGTEDAAIAIDVSFGDTLRPLHAPDQPDMTIEPATLTSRRSVPRLTVPRAQLAALPLDHRAGFLLAHVDGKETLRNILDVCAMPDAEAIALLNDLVRLGVIAFD